MFHPVELIHPKSGKRYSARSAVDLNDRLAEGYVRPLPPTPPVPAPYIDQFVDYDESL